MVGRRPGARRGQQLLMGTRVKVREGHSMVCEPVGGQPDRQGRTAACSVLVSQGRVGRTQPVDRVDHEERKEKHTLQSSVIPGYY